MEGKDLFWRQVRLSAASIAKGNPTMNFNSEFNKIIVCREFGYTEDEYDSNSLEFNIMAGILLSEESKVSKNRQKIGSIPKLKVRRK